MVGRIVLPGPRYLFLGWSVELCYRVRGTFSSDGRSSCVTGSEVPFPRMVGRIVLPGPRYLFLGWSVELCYRVRGTFSSDGRPNCVTGSEVPFSRTRSAELCYAVTNVTLLQCRGLCKS